MRSIILKIHQTISKGMDVNLLNHTTKIMKMVNNLEILFMLKSSFNNRMVP